MITGDVTRIFADEFLKIAVASPLILAGLRYATHRDRWRLIGLGVLVILLTDAATGLCWLPALRIPGHHWNWTGKAACVVTIAVFIRLLPSEIIQKSGIFSLPLWSSFRPVTISLVLCTLLGMSAGVPPGFRVDGETLAFQLSMPSLAEEPVYRGLFPAILCTAFGSPWKLGGSRLGWWWLTSGMLFGLGHGMNWSSQGAIEFHLVPAVLTGLVGLSLGWLAARCGSIWPCVMCHSLINSTGVAIAFVKRFLLG